MRVYHSAPRLIDVIQVKPTVAERREDVLARGGRHHPRSSDLLLHGRQTVSSYPCPRPRHIKHDLFRSSIGISMSTAHPKGKKACALQRKEDKYSGTQH